MANITSLNNPATLAGMDVDTELVLKAINKKLQMETTLGDIFEELGAEVVNSGKKMMVPNAIFMKLESPESGARQVTIPMLKPLNDAPTIGSGTPIGSEETREMNYVTFYYDEYSHAVSIENWGINYNEMNMYGVFAQAQPSLSKYMKEFRGQRIREALLLTYDSVLSSANATAPKSAHWNKNWFVPNTAIGSQPSWDNTAPARSTGGGVLTASYASGTVGTPTAGTYLVTQKATSGSGTGVRLAVTMSTSAVTAVEILEPGSGYAAADTVTVDKANLGDTTADIVFDVDSVRASNGLISGDFFGGGAALTNFTNEIAYTLLAAANVDTAGFDGTDAEISLDYLQALEYYASNYLRIDPIMVDGKETYVVLVPSTQATILRKNTSGQLGEIWTSMARTSGDEMNYNGYINRVGKLMLIEDQRYPTLQITGEPDFDGSGAAAQLVIEPQFVRPGNVDDRHKDAFVGKDASAAGAVIDSADKCNFDIGFLLGKGAIAEWEVRKLHFEREIQNYGKYEGVGVFGESGIQLVQWDDDGGWDSTDNNRENFGSIVLPFATPAVVTVDTGA